VIKININLPERSYPIYITTGFGDLESCFEHAGIEGKVAVITDENVDRYYSQKVQLELENAGRKFFKYIIKPGEGSKNLNTISGIYSFLINNGFDRQSSIVALGGGVVGDIAGFAAATFLRGVNFIQMPTSLLAQADSSVGGKVGVDFKNCKNIIGAFYQPKFVYINVNSLKTLPARELKAGLAETLKHGLIIDENFYEYIEYNLEKIFYYDIDVLQHITKVNCRIKGDIVEKDEKESCLRAILNFGHTIGHAVESMSDFKLLHGECVAVGIIGAYKMARYLGMVSEDTVSRVIKTVERIGLPVYIKGLDIEQVYNQMFYDKKVKKGILNFILPKRIGEVIICSVEDQTIIKSVLSEIIK
jgi:3-dehydroquinate synthase